MVAVVVVGAPQLSKLFTPDTVVPGGAMTLEFTLTHDPLAIDDALLVGGSTRVPLVQQRVKELFGKDPGKGVNPDEVVAIGAAVQAALIEDNVAVEDLDRVFATIRAELGARLKRGIWIIADDVYARIIYDRPLAPSFIALAEPDDLVLAINSFSKSWSMTGWRLGWITAPAALLDDATATLLWAYRYIDRRLQEVYDGLDADDVFVVMSDHGIRSPMEHSRDAIFVLSGAGVPSGRAAGQPALAGVPRILAGLLGVSTPWPDSGVAPWVSAERIASLQP